MHWSASPLDSRRAHPWAPYPFPQDTRVSVREQLAKKRRASRSLASPSQRAGTRAHDRVYVRRAYRGPAGLGEHQPEGSAKAKEQALGLVGGPIAVVTRVVRIAQRAVFTTKWRVALPRAHLPPPLVCPPRKATLYPKLRDIACPPTTCCKRVAGHRAILYAHNVV